MHKAKLVVRNLDNTRKATEHIERNKKNEVLIMHGEVKKAVTSSYDS